MKLYINYDRSLSQEPNNSLYTIQDTYDMARHVFIPSSKEYDFYDKNKVGVMQINMGIFILIDLNTFNRMTNQTFSWDELVLYLIQHYKHGYKLKELV